MRVAAEEAATGAESATGAADAGTTVPKARANETADTATRLRILNKEGPPKGVSSSCQQAADLNTLRRTRGLGNQLQDELAHRETSRHPERMITFQIVAAIGIFLTTAALTTSLRKRSPTQTLWAAVALAASASLLLPAHFDQGVGEATWMAVTAAAIAGWAGSYVNRARMDCHEIPAGKFATMSSLAALAAIAICFG